MSHCFLCERAAQDVSWGISPRDGVQSIENRKPNVLREQEKDKDSRCSYEIDEYEPLNFFDITS